MEKWVRANYQPNLPLGEDGRKVTACAEHLALARKAGTEGMVLLKNAGKILPLAKGSRLALFGKGVFDYVKGGGGSGDVTVSHVRNLYDGLKEEKGLAEIYEPLADFYRGRITMLFVLAVGILLDGIYNLVGYLCRWRHIYLCYQSMCHTKMTPSRIEWDRLAKKDAYGVPAALIIGGIVGILVSIFLK